MALFRATLRTLLKSRIEQLSMRILKMNLNSGTELLNSGMARSLNRQ